MQRFLFLVACFIIIAGPAGAQYQFETQEEARQRHSSEQFQFRQRYGNTFNNAPETFGDPGGVAPSYLTPSRPRSRSTYDTNQYRFTPETQRDYYSPRY